MIMTIGKKQNNFIFIPYRPNDIFNRLDDPNVKIIYIKNILRDPVLKVRFGNLYNEKDLNFEEGEKLYSVNTFKTLFDLGLISHEYNEENPICKDWLLSELIQSEFYIPHDVLDYIYKDKKDLYDENRISSFLSLVQTKSTAEWLIKNGAKLKIISGFGNPIEWQEINENTEVLEFFCNNFNCETIDELKALLEKED